MKKLFWLLLFSVPCFAADPPTTTAPNDAWLKYTIPGEGHKVLNDLAGNWNYTLKFWMTPGGKAEESKGKSVNKWALGGRFLQQEVKAKMGKQVFEGTGFTAFDNLKEQYQSVWMDTMSTALMWSTGNFDPASKTLTQTGNVADPMTGEKDKGFRTQLKIASKDAHVFEMYGKGADGAEFRMMEINYQRVK